MEFECLSRFLRSLRSVEMTVGGAMPMGLSGVDFYVYDVGGGAASIEQGLADEGFGNVFGEAVDWW